MQIILMMDETIFFFSYKSQSKIRLYVHILHFLTNVFIENCLCLRNPYNYVQSEATRILIKDLPEKV